MKVIRTINKINKLAGCKINIQKTVVFLYTNNELSERKKKNSVYNCIKSVDCLGEYGNFNNINSSNT